MLDYTVKRYSKELNWAISDVLVEIDGFTRNYPYCDTSRMISSLAELDNLVSSIIVFPGLDIEWSVYHRNLDAIIMLDPRVSSEKRLLWWYLVKYREQRTLKLKHDLMNYYGILEFIVNRFVGLSKEGDMW